MTLNRLKEYLRLGRLFNAEILGCVFILSYLLTSRLNEHPVEMGVVLTAFIAGILAHVWGCYNNDRWDLPVDRQASYCLHKPLVSGRISVSSAVKVEFGALFSFVLILLALSPRLSTTLYLVGFIGLALLYNRFNKSNMFIDIIGQLYATFFALAGMSVVKDFDGVVFLSAILLGLNGVYLNIVEADLKDIEGDVVNVPKALGVVFQDGKAINKTKFDLLNEVLKLIMFILILVILHLENAGTGIFITAWAFFLVNWGVRRAMFARLSSDREKMKRYIALQELTSVFLISTIYMIVHYTIPVIVVGFVVVWLTSWNSFLWGTLVRPQV